MSSSTTPATQNGSPFKGVWPLLAPYVASPVAASAAIVPPFRYLMEKSAQQRGLPVPRIPILTGLKEGVKAAPNVGLIIAIQLALQQKIENALTGDESKSSLPSKLGSSALVGVVSIPPLAFFDGQTMGWTMRETLRRFTPKQGLAIAFQETSFVGGQSVSDRLASAMKRQFGDHWAIDYVAAYTAGAFGSLAGHPGNTALTRWQNGLTVDGFRQSMLGAARKGHAIGVFSVLYRVGNKLLNPPAQKPTV